MVATFNWNDLAGFKWTASIALRTVTSGEMVDDSTFCVVATQTWAWVAAFLVNADLSGSAVGVENALWFTSLAGVTKIFRKTLTNCQS